jgi:ABC-type lipoprotein release transport system permease subunit
MKSFSILFSIAAKNVRLHWRHSLAAVISISASFISLVIFQGYMQDVNLMYLETFRSRMMYGDVMIENESMQKPEGKANPLKFAIFEKDQQILLRRLEDRSARIDSIVRFLNVDGMISASSTSTIMRGYGYDVIAGAKMRGKNWAWNTVYGVPLQNADFSSSLLLGQSLGQILGCQPIEKQKIINSVSGYEAKDRPFKCTSTSLQLTSIAERGQINAIDLQATGLVDAAYKDIDNKFVALDLQQAQSLLNTKSLSYVTVKLKDQTQVPAFIKDLQSELRATNPQLKVLRWENHPVGDIYVRTMDLLSVFRNFVVIIIIAIAALSIFNTMLKVVKERTREIGVLQSLGFPGHKIATIFTIEATLLALLGSGIGAVGALLFTSVLNFLGIVYKAGILVEPVVFHVLIDPWLYLGSAVLLSTLSILIALFAARSTLRQQASVNLSET